MRKHHSILSILFIVIAVILNPLSLTAQANLHEEPRIFWGMPLPKSGKEDLIKIIGVHKDQLIILKRDRLNIFENEKWHLEQYPENNPSKKETTKIPLTLGKEEIELTLEKVIILNSTIVVIAGNKQKKNKVNDLYFCQFNANDKSFSSYTPLTSLLMDDKSNVKEDIVFCSAADELYSIKLTTRNPDPNSIEINRYNAKIELTGKKTIELKEIGEDWIIQNAMVSSENFLFFNLKNTNQGNHHTLISLNFDQNLTNLVELEIPKMEILSMHFTLEKNQLFIAGLLKEKKKNASPSAYYWAGFDQSLQTIYPLKYSDINAIEEKGIKSKEKNRDWEDLKSIQLVKSNQGLFLVSEQQRVDNICISDFRTGFIRCNDYYYFVDILCVFIALEGSSWKTTLHKYQSSIDDNGINGSVLVSEYHENGIFIVFNDHVKNFEKKEEEIKTMSNASKSICTGVSIDRNGKVSKVKLYSSKEQNIILQPRIGMGIRNKAYYVYGEKNGTSRIGKLMLP
jgi:hypothetical protein